MAQATPKKCAESYVVSVDVSSGKKKLGEGEYSVTLVVADALYAAPLVWREAATVRVLEEEEQYGQEELAALEYEPVDDEVPRWACSM